VTTGVERWRTGSVGRILREIVRPAQRALEAAAPGGVIMPGRSRKPFLADTYVNVMSQYRPAHRAGEYPELSRRLTRTEYREAVEWATSAGLTQLDVQGWRW